MFRVSHGLLRVSFRTLGALFAIVTLAAILVGWRLSQGPISLGFLTPYIQEQVGDLPGGYQVTLSETVLAWRGWDNQLDILALDSELLNQDGRVVVKLPETAMRFDGKSLFHGRLRPTEITIRDARLQLIRRADGTIGLVGADHGAGEAGAENEADAVPMLRQLLDSTSSDGAENNDQKLAESLMSHLREIRLKGAAFSLRDDLRGEKHIVTDAEIWIRNRQQNLDLDASLVWVSRMGRVPLTVTADYDVAGDMVDGELLFNNVIPSEFQEHYQVHPALANIPLAVSGQIRAMASAVDGLRRIDFDLVTGGGKVKLPNFSKSWSVDSLSVAGSYSLIDKQLVLANASYQIGNMEISAAGRADLTGELPGVFMTVTGKNINAAHITHYWPVNRAAQTRGWLLDHIRSGNVGAARAELKVQPHMWGKDDIPADALNVDFSFRNVHAKLYEPYDDLKQAQGRARLTGKSFDLTLESGQSGQMAFSDGRVSLPDLGTEVPLVIIDTVGKGTVPQILNAVIRGRLKENVAANVNIDDFSGDAAVRLHMELPAKDDLQVEEMIVRAAANVRNLIARNAFEGKTAIAEQAQVKVDLDGLTVEGKFKVDQVPMTVRWNEEFAAGLEYSTHLQLTVPRMTIGELARFGVSLPRSIQGDLAMTAILHQGSGSKMAANVNADIRGVSIFEPDIGVKKLSGQAGALTFAAYAQQKGAYRLTDVVLDSPSVKAEGELEIDDRLGVWFVDLKRFRNSGSDVSVTLVNKDGTGWNGRVAGPQLHVGELIEAENAATATNADDSVAAQDEPFGPIALKIDVERLRYDDDIFFSNAQGDVQLDDDGLVRLQMNSRLRGEAVTTINVDRAEGQHLINVESPDAGSVFAALGITSKVAAGRLQGSAVRDIRSGDLKGQVTLNDFTVNDTPAMAKLMTLASLTGLANRLSGQGIEFTRAEALFRTEGDELTILKGRTAGPAVGLTAKGKYSFQDRSLTMVGTVIPAYAISSLLGNIPIIGNLLVADQGILGVTYRVEGPADDPAVSVNPLSALAPGILKRMFVESVENTPVTTEEFEVDGTEGN